MKKTGEMDRMDRRIIAELSKDGRISMAALATKVGLSKTPCQLRVRTLQDQGVILGYRAVLDQEKLGREHVAFVEVKLIDTSEAALSSFNSAVASVSEIEQCHMIAGAFDYLLKVRTQDIKEYRQVLGEVISALPHVANTSTHVSMQSVKDRN